MSFREDRAAGEGWRTLNGGVVKRVARIFFEEILVLLHGRKRL